MRKLRSRPSFSVRSYRPIYASTCRRAHARRRMTSWVICGIIVVIILFLVWYAVQDCSLNLKFWSYFGRKEDKVLRGKVAFITGAGSGIGQALALRWASKSVRLALNDFNESALLETKEKCISIIGAKDEDILLLSGDVTDVTNHEKWISEILSTFDQLDILANNAGRLVLGRAARVPFSVGKAIFDVNAMAPIGLTTAVLPHFLERRTGFIVQVSSLSAQFPSMPMVTSYAASKAAVQSYFLSMRAEVVNDGISVTVACPGPVMRTNIASNSLKVEGFESVLQRVLKYTHNPRVKAFLWMRRRRCAELISKAMVNRISVACISTQPFLFFAQVQPFVPSCLSHWIAASVTYPLMFRMFDAGDSPSSP